MHWSQRVWLHINIHVLEAESSAVRRGRFKARRLPGVLWNQHQLVCERRAPVVSESLLAEQWVQSNSFALVSIIFKSHLGRFPIALESAGNHCSQTLLASR